MRAKPAIGRRWPRGGVELRVPDECSERKTQKNREETSPDFARRRGGIKGPNFSRTTHNTAAVPPIHQKALGKILVGKMLNALYPNIGPHKNSAGSSLMYLLR